jgi:radical S-adenosyl methionine domain-containing protein 2
MDIGTSPHYGWENVSNVLLFSGQYLDILAVSCDSFNEATNKTIGRGQGNRNHVKKLMKICNWCHQYRVAFKINTVVNTYNVEEDMTEQIVKLNPVRWKVM